MSSHHTVRAHKGRGALSNPGVRFDAHQREGLGADEEQWPGDGEAPAEETIRPRTVVTLRQARTIISRNQSPDIGFGQSINPYQGCEHGCVYCYARPTHAYLGLSPGLDFETQITAKANAATLLRAELARPGYVPGLIVLGANTDPYQPAERRLGLTRALLEVLSEAGLPVGIITKNALVTRDLDLLAPMAARGLLHVCISVTTLDNALARILDPRASAPGSRLRAMAALAQAGIPVAVFASPMIPAINDTELEKILQAAAQAGARYASYVLLRLPLELRDLFVQWLQQHFALRADHVMQRVHQMRGGRDYDPAFATRMKGDGVFAELLARRFAIALKRYGLEKMPKEVNLSQFQPPLADSAQGRLF